MLHWRSAARSHVGLVRKVNEDSLFVADKAGLWVVADGMGGHENGQWASQTLVAQFAELAAGRISTNDLFAALDAGNHAIVTAGEAQRAQMGTTVVVAHASHHELLCLWVGDSRIYRWRDHALTQLTRDHSVVQELIDRGRLAPDEADEHPMSHVLSRAVGTESALNIDRIAASVQPGDRFLLCSDGLTKVVPEALIANVLGSHDIDEAADALIAATLELGAPDNVTLVLLSAEKGDAA
jgi:serine/threonine protein phosphatase PrpC